MKLGSWGARAYLGEKVVNEKEYLSAIITVYADGSPTVSSVMSRGREELREVYCVGNGGKLSCVVVARRRQATRQGSSGRELACVALNTRHTLEYLRSSDGFFFIRSNKATSLSQMILAPPQFPLLAGNCLYLTTI